MKRNLNKLFFLLFIFFSIASLAKDEILFSVNNKPVTSIDLNQRINYLRLIQNIDINNIDSIKYINDLVSVKIFDEFALKRRVDIKDEEINKYYNKIISNKKKIYNNLIKNNELTQANILKNIKFDLQRKKIIEYLIEDKIKNLDIESNYSNIIDIYNIKINYFIISKDNNPKIKNNYKKFLNKDINTIKNNLDSSNIKYNFFSKEIINLERISNKIKANIIDNNEVFYIEENDYLMIGTIEKKFKEDIDLKYSFYQILPKKNIDFDSIVNEKIYCNNIKNLKLNKKIEIKEYKKINLLSLNKEIFENFSKVNEKIVIKNLKQNFIILLCNIDYNKEIAHDKIFDEKIQKLANEIEIEFVKIKKNEYKFQKFY